MEIPARAPDWHIQHERERQIDERRSSHGAGFAPIETRVSEEYGDSAQDESDEAQCVNPVSDAHQSGMPRRIQNF
jgi:hypothetical protein